MMSIERIQLCFLWLMMVIGMMLHFDYHVSGIFYGIDLRLPGATGSFPSTIWVIRFLFQLIPMMMATFILFFEESRFRRFHFGVSVLFTLAHASHLAQELFKPDVSQWNLLILVLILSALQTLVSYRWVKTL